MKDQEFVNRKVDHIRIALVDDSEAKARSDLGRVTLIHDSLPDFDFGDIHLKTSYLNRNLATPFFIAGMTAGHQDAEKINQRLAKSASQRGWIMGLGSQRREIDSEYKDSWAAELKIQYPNLELVSNLGITQLIELSQKNDWKKLEEMLARTKASALAIHLNPLQEIIQLEGTPQFKGSLEALEGLKKNVSFPIILKETGSGMSLSFLKRIIFLQPWAVDVSGLGGTHWGRVEGLRAPAKSLTSELGECFKNWGVGTLASIANARIAFQNSSTEIWASGGIRNGLDAAKCIALGATRVGFAKPALEAAMQGSVEVNHWMSARETELKVALFCTNSAELSQLDLTKVERREIHEA